LTRSPGCADRRADTTNAVAPWRCLNKIGAQVRLQWVIYVPWVPDLGKFKGAVIYSIRPL
jgi:hypothetical protein